MLPLLLIFSFQSFAGEGYIQYYPMDAERIPFYEDEHQLSDPYAGGLLKASFGHIDLNKNGKKDLLVLDSDDQSVMTFLNEGEEGAPEYRYDPDYEVIIPQLNNFVITRDFNDNGRMDIFTLDGSSGIRVYRNLGGSEAPRFKKEHDRLYYRTISGDDTSQTNVSMHPNDIPAIADVTGNGALDIVVMSRLGGYANFYKNYSLHDYDHKDTLLFEYNDECWGRFWEAIADTARYELGAGHDWCDNSRDKRHAGATTTLMDITHDGAMDLIIADADQPKLDLLINGKMQVEDPPHPKDSMIKQVSRFPVGHSVDIPNQPGAYPIDVDGNDYKDLIVAPRGVNPVQPVDQIWYYKNQQLEDSTAFEFVQEDFLQENMIDQGAENLPRFVDINDNGLKDLILTTKREIGEFEFHSPQMVLYLNEGDEQNPEFHKADEDFLNFSGNVPEGFSPTFADLTRNGRPDMIAGRYDGGLDFYANVGDEMAEFEKREGALDDIDVGEYSVPYLYDFNDSGWPDLIVGNKEGTIHYFENDRNFEEPEYSKVTDALGDIFTADFYVTSGDTFYRDGFSAPSVADINDDGNPEILVGSEERGVLAYKADPDNPEADFEEIDTLFSDYDARDDVTQISGNKVKPDLAVLEEDSLPVIFKGISRGGMLAYDSEEKESPSIPIIEPEDASENWTLFPNPVSSDDELNIIAEEHLNDQPVTIIFADITGEVLEVKEEEMKNASFTVSPNGDWGEGYYLIRVIDDSGEALFDSRFILRE